MKQIDRTGNQKKKEVEGPGTKWKPKWRSKEDLKENSSYCLSFPLFQVIFAESEFLKLLNFNSNLIWVLYYEHYNYMLTYIFF